MRNNLLKMLLAYHKNLTFEQFCKDIYPDFDSVQSGGRLRGKFALFKHNVISFLIQLEPDRMAQLSVTIFEQNVENKLAS